MESKKEVKKTKNNNLASNTVIDNTAPLSDIIQKLYSRERRFSKPYQLYHQLLAQRRFKGLSRSRDRWLFHFALPGHPLNAFTDDYDGEIDYRFFEEFPYKSLMPKYITKINNQQTSDPVTDLLKKKHEWKYKIVKDRSLTVGICAKKTKIERLNTEVMQVPQYVVDLAAHVDRDPDKYFAASYNWYYSGSGNLQLVTVHWVDYLLRSVFSCVSLSRFHKDTLTIDHDDTTSFDCEQNILETIYSSNIVALRTSFKIVILKILDNDGKLHFEKLKSFESELPFTSIAFDKVHTNILYATALNCKLNIVNIDRMTAKSEQLKKPVSLVDNWNTVIGVSRGIYMHVDRNCLTGYDKRTNKPVDAWAEVSDIADEMDCNDLSAVVQVEDSPHFYFATEHHLFLMDSRCSRKNKLKVVQRWTHGMQCVPTYISVQRGELNKEFVFLSSQWCEDMCVVSNYADRLTRTTDIKGMCVPYRPPSVFNTLFEARQKLLCMDMSNEIETRLAHSICGKIEVDLGTKFSVLMQNGVGDISSHVLYPLYMEDFMEDDGAQQLHEWTKGYKVDKEPFQVTGIHNFGRVWKQLRRMPDNFDGFKIVVETYKPMPSDDEIYDVFRNEEVMPELLDAWEAVGRNIDQSHLDLNINVYSDIE